MQMKISVLGTTYTLIEKEREEDQGLTAYDGYVEFEEKIIVMAKQDSQQYRKKVIRHELVHAFLYESGLDVNTIESWARNEEMVDWIAIQIPKMAETMSLNELLY